MEAESFYEIELKSLLTKQKYEELLQLLAKKTELINKETLRTTRYHPGDIRLRHSDAKSEIIAKEEGAIKIVRKEVRIPVPKQQLKYFAKMLLLANLSPMPPWIKHKHEFTYHFRGFDYIICLQHIENFAYILEVEFISKTDDSQIHEPNLRAIISELGCEPINPEDFSKKVGEYIKTNQAPKTNHKP